MPVELCSDFVCLVNAVRKLFRIVDEV
jgi:hypothetical protein